MSKITEAKKPFTPIRNLVADLFKPSIALGKRERSKEPDSVEKSRLLLTAQAKSDPPDSAAGPPRLPAVALQNEDADSEAVVITALKPAPFCCHEDLLTMPREKLVNIALILNERLPATMQLDIDPSYSDAMIRRNIEQLVGIRRKTDAPPPAPRPVKMHKDLERVSRVDIADSSGASPPSSPLAMRIRSNDSRRTNPRLGILREEDEGAAFAPPCHASKRKRVSSNNSEHLQQRQPNTQGFDRMSCSPAQKRRVTRAMSQRDVYRQYTASASSPPGRVLRSQSQKLPAEMKRIKVDTTFITMVRPKYRFRKRKSSSRVAESPEQHLQNVNGDVKHHSEPSLLSK